MRLGRDIVGQRTEALVAHNRHGPPGRVPVRFDGQRMRFEEIRGPQELEPEARATMDGVGQVPTPTPSSIH